MKIRAKWLQRKRTFLFICLILTALLLSQLGLFIYFSPKMSGDSTSQMIKTPANTNHQAGSAAVTHRIYQLGRVANLTSQRTSMSREEDMKTFLSKCLQHQVSILSVDRYVLNKLMKAYTSMKSSKLSLCPLFCFQKVATFAIFQELFEQNESSFFEDLLAQGFRLVTLEGPDPKQLPNVTIRLHHLISKGDLVIHLAAFHHRSGNFWWHGKLDLLNNKESLRREFPALKFGDLQFASKQGAYDKFDIRPVQVEDAIIYFPRMVDAFLDQMKTSIFFPCNLTRAQLFHDAYGWMDKPSDLFQMAALKALSGAKKVLDGLRVPFWLSSGTCLGFFRQCDLISYSRDVDIGIFIQDYDPRIVRTFASHRFKLKHKLGKVVDIYQQHATIFTCIVFFDIQKFNNMEDSLELSFVIAGIKLDIFFFYEETNHTWNGGLQTKSGKKFKYIFSKFTLCWTEFLYLKVRVPCETERYLQANYGLNWFEPVLNWDWKSSPSNVQENGQWAPEEWPEVIQQFDVE